MYRASLYRAVVKAGLNPVDSMESNMEDTSCLMPCLTAQASILMQAKTEGSIMTAFFLPLLVTISLEGRHCLICVSTFFR